MNYIWSLWSGKAERHDGPLPIQVAEIDEMHEALKSIINLYDKREIVKEALEQISGLSNPRWEDRASLNLLSEYCRVALSQINYHSISK